MKIALSTLALALIALLAVSGCSKNETGDSAKTDTGETTMTKSSNDVYAATDTTKPDTTKADTTAEKVYPIRNPKHSFVTIETDFGKMVLELYKDVAPAHADSFVALSKKGFYNGTIFHRIVKNFMIQGGDPKGNGTGNAGYYLKAEFNEILD